MKTIANPAIPRVAQRDELLRRFGSDGEGFML
jgi:hypothetical protein